jgi:hypothetical protein
MVECAAQAFFAKWLRIGHFYLANLFPSYSICVSHSYLFNVLFLTGSFYSLRFAFFATMSPLIVLSSLSSSLPILSK